MVPDHDLFEIKPKSGEIHGTRGRARKDISGARENDAQNNRNRRTRGETRLCLWRWLSL
jgi:hypothetical protein